MAKLIIELEVDVDPARVDPNEEARDILTYDEFGGHPLSDLEHGLLHKVQLLGAKWRA